MAAKSVKKNFIFHLIYQLLLLISPLIVTPYLTRRLGPGNVGLYSFANSAVSYFLLVAVLGTATYGQREVSYAQDDPEGRSRTFWEVFLLRLFTTFVTLGGYLIFACFRNQNERLIYLILALNILNVACDVSWFLQGMEEFGKTVLCSLVFRFASIAGIFLLVKSPSDLWLYVLFMTAFTILGNLAMWLYLPKYLVRVKKIRPFHDFKTVLQLFIPTIAVQIYTVLDKSMIGWFSPSGDFSENGYYEEAEKIVKVALTAVTSLGIVMIPRISHTFRLGDMERVKSYLYKSYRFVFLMSIPIMLGFISLADVFSPVYFGSGYEKCEILIPILSGILLFIGLSNVTGMQFFIPTGRQNFLTLSVTVGAAVNFVCNLILIPKYSSIGASIATVIAEFSVALVGFLYILLTKQFSLRPVFLCCGKYVLSGLVMFTALFFCKRLLPAAVWSLVLLIGFGALLYFALLLILRDVFLLEILSKGFSAFKRLFKREKGEKDSGEKE